MDNIENIKIFWDKIIDGLNQVLQKEIVNTWFGVLTPVQLNDHKLILEAPNQFFIEWISQYYLDYLRAVIEKLNLNNLQIEFQVKKEATSTNRPEFISTNIGPVNESRLSPRYTFDNFIVGESNRLCYAAAKAVADAPARAYNPLFIYGGVGLGKTHLLHAIGNYVKRKYPHLKVYYTPAEEMFLNLIQSIQDRNPSSFNNKYRNLDLLLLDDIHYLKGKERLQEDVFHLFNHLHMMGKQIVFTSDRPPREIPTLEERLVSRLLSGMVCDLKPPDIETRIAILNNKAKQENIKIGPDVIFFIAENIKTNIRELEGALIRLSGYASLTNTPITIEIAKQVLSDLFTHKPLPKPMKILELVASYYNVTIEQLQSKERTQNLALARQVAMYFLRSVGGLSLKEIGAYLGGKDHSTVIHAIEKITELKKQNEKISKDLEQIALLINGE
ncbi:MAG: chromosomal replication initiator protein DnaA [candidate division WOR-3 bacterium]|nr:chromosomal replication initiator protein DnaA [candidate division WOR-3 bacterium]MCX7757938.1 chromosomal replication initiator protein DnaA [candidate division WOR-3 bacterium]MDW7987700.1 chromosomal replication initiator protein DnaA [candidate division WOR-3 bacterium]